MHIDHGLKAFLGTEITFEDQSQLQSKFLANSWTFTVPTSDPKGSDNVHT